MSFFEPFTGRVKHPGTSSKVTLVHPAAQILSASECKAPWVHLLVNGYNFRKSEVILPKKMKIIAVQCGTPNGETLYIHLFQSKTCVFWSYFHYIWKLPFGEGYKPSPSFDQFWK